MKSPEDFAIGLGQGTASLVKHTLSGVFGAASKITGKVAEGITMLSMDEEYIESRKKSRREKKKHVIEGVGDGLMGLGKGELSAWVCFLLVEYWLFLFCMCFFL